MLPHSSEVWKSRTKVSTGPAHLRPQAGRFLASKRGCWPCPQHVSACTLPSPRLPSPLCVCVHLLSAYEDTRHRELGSTLMAFSLTCFRMRPHRRWLGPHPFGGRGHSFCPRNWLLSVVSVLGGREGCASCVGLRGQHQGAAPLCRWPGRPPGLVGRACPSLASPPQLPCRAGGVCAGV